MILKFTVPGGVQAKERHRTAALKRCMACRRTVIGYPCKYCGGTSLEFVANVSTPGKKSETYESFVALCAREAGAVSGSTGAVRLTAKFFFAVPVSRKRKLAEGQFHTQRPDLDNCLKSIKDGLNQVAWHDDCCVVEIHAWKLWTHGEPRAEIVVESLETVLPDATRSRAGHVNADLQLEAPGTAPATGHAGGELVQPELLTHPASKESAELSIGLGGKQKSMPAVVGPHPALEPQLEKGSEPAGTLPFSRISETAEVLAEFPKSPFRREP